MNLLYLLWNGLASRSEMNLRGHTQGTSIKWFGGVFFSVCWCLVKTNDYVIIYPTSFVKSDLYKQGLVLFLNTVWRLCKCDLKVSTHTLRPDTWEKGKEIQKYQSFPLNSLRKSQVLVNLCITLLWKLILILVNLSI